MSALEVRVTNGSAPAGWDQRIAECDGPVFHTSSWARFVVASSPTIIPVFVELRDDDGPCGYVLAFRDAGRTLASRVLSRRLWTDAMPAMRPNRPPCLGAAVDALLQYARHSGDVEVALGSYGDTGQSAALSRPGLAHRRRLEFPLGLQPNPDALLQSLRPTRRQSIRAAKRAGVMLEQLDVDEGPPVLRRLQAASAVRIEARGGQLQVPVYDRGEDPVTVLLRDGVGHLVGARVGDTIESVGLFTVFNGRAYLVLAGHSSAGLRAQAPSALIWDMALRLGREGCRELNLGGCGGDAVEPSSSEHGMYLFKRSFRSPVIECLSVQAILRRRRFQTRQLLRRVLHRE